MTDDTVNIGQAPDATPTVNITPTTPQVDIQTANLRASKAQFGLSKYLPDYTKDSWYTSIISGQEGEARKAASASINYADTQRRLKELNETGRLSPPNLSNPDSVIEKGFADKFMHPMTDMSNDFYKQSLYGDANREDPSVVGNMAASASDAATKVQQVQSSVENNKPLIDMLPELQAQWTANELKSADNAFIKYPLVAAGVLQTFASGSVKAVKDAIDTAYKASLGQPTTVDEEMNAAIVAAGMTMRTFPKMQLAKAAADAVKASATVDGSRPVETVQSAAHGDMPTAAKAQVAADVNAGNSPKAEHDRDIRSLTSNFRLDQAAIEANPGNYGTDIVNRIRDANDGLVTNLSKKIQTVMKVNRTPQVMAQEAVIADEQARIRGTYRGLGNAILDIGAPEYDELSNTWHSTARIGTFDGELFPREKQAKLFAELHGIVISDKEGTGATIKQQGSGFYIETKKPFKEDSESLVGDPKTGLASTPDTRSPRSWLNSWTKGFLASPPMTMSQAEMANRRVTAHTPSVVKHVADSDWDIVNSVHKDSWGKFNQLLDAGRDLYDKDGNKGYFFESPGEIEDWYYKNFPNAGRPPGDLVEGYFAYKRLNNMDLAFRNISMYRYQARMGTESHQWSVKDKDGKQIKSGFVSGIKIDKLPAGNDTVMILNQSKGLEQYVSAKKLGTTSLGKKTAEDIQQGKAHVVEIWDPDQKALGAISPRSNGTRVRYVISYKPPETKPLDIGQMVNRRGGGHFDYKFEGHVVQPVIEYDPVTKTHNYTGDRIMTMHDNPGEGKHFAQLANTVREYRKAGMYDEARSVARDTLAMGDEEFSRWFAPREMPNGGKLAPYLSDEHPLKYIRRGESYIDHADDAFFQKYRKLPHGESFRDATTSGSPAAQFKVQYTQKRDAEQMFGARNKGTVNNPLWSYEPVKMVDPLPVTARAINRIANSLAGDDMKIAAITHWLKEAEPHLDYGKNTHSIIWSSPWRTFNAGDLPWKRNSENLDVVRALEGNRLKIKAFSGAFNPQERFMHAQAVKLAVSLYGKGYTKSSIAPTWMLPALVDPWRVARSIAVHPILGMFKPSAFGMQLTTWSNVVGIAGPKHAGPGLVASLLHEFTRVNDHPNTLKLYDELAAKGPEFGWRPGEWKEARDKLQDSGFFNVGSEHAYEANQDRYNPIKNAAGQVLYAGMTPFREGAQYVRASSWFTAYHEYRNGGGGKFFGENWNGHTGPIDPEGWQRILNRAGTLDHNMSRAANAPYQAGPGSLPTMFWSYKLRLTELMLSKQLTVPEKVRLFGTSSLMFGALYGGAGLFGLPVGDYVRSSALSGNWDVPGSEAVTGMPINIGHTTPYTGKESFWLSAAIEGLPATFVAWLTGALDSKKSVFQNVVDINKKSYGEVIAQGNRYNFGEYFGNASLAEDIVRDKTIMQMALGAPGTFYATAWKTSTKLAASLWDLVGKQDAGTSLNDLKEAARSINAINAAYAVVTAAGTHNWMTRNNTVMQSDVSAGNAVFMGLTGLHDQSALDNYDRRRIMTHQMEARNHGEQMAISELHFWMDALNNNDPDAAEAHKAKAMSLLAVVEYPHEKIEKFIEKALDSYQKNVPEDIARKFFKPDRWPKGVSDEQLESARKTYYEGKTEPDYSKKKSATQPNEPGEVDIAPKETKPTRSHHKKAP